MLSLELEILKYIKIDNLLKNYTVFIETGTFMGETIFRFEKNFNKLHTIEIKSEFYNDAKNKYTGNKITFHLGDSSIKLIDICKTLNNNVIFFLDGHWSAGNTGRGSKDCPLYEELEAINNNLNNKAIIIIDDCRLFGLGPNTTNGQEVCNWEDINIDKILNLVKNRLDKYYNLPSKLNKNDRLILHLNEKLY
ncbi:hypothetical protein ceV_012 [Chrysochromulina ericina virus CeV-01B]|uniref:Methyltransferase n=1 Tax=Chrysochromulina ericina virus CeV-01B TaxID=3070830 RepID=A0A0N9QIR6_9VIRU|nr:hypothetical protein ceV_012 [Chrysochromulina ericina virus]ALH22918.1 hypothetical protein ceV_012 [Chrysochromulina ericina virus CeV-01B]